MKNLTCYQDKETYSFQVILTKVLHTKIFLVLDLLKLKFIVSFSPDLKYSAYWILKDRSLYFLGSGVQVASSIFVRLNLHVSLLSFPPKCFY